MFKEYYRRRFREILEKHLAPNDGLGDVKVATALRKKGLIIPRTLAEYYAVAGKHTINVAYNRLLPIEKLAWRSERLVFMEENQEVAYWGLDRNSLSESNPVVWQAANQESEPLQWFKEPYRLKQFLLAMWHWQQSGIEEKPERRQPRTRKG